MDPSQFALLTRTAGRARSSERTAMSRRAPSASPSGRVARFAGRHATRPLARRWRLRGA